LFFRKSLSILIARDLLERSVVVWDAIYIVVPWIREERSARLHTVYMNEGMHAKRESQRYKELANVIKDCHITNCPRPPKVLHIKRIPGGKSRVVWVAKSCGSNSCT